MQTRNEDEDEDFSPIEELDDNDFSDLDNLLAEATAATEDDRALKAAKKRLAKVVRSNHPDAALEQQELVAAIRRLEEGRVWLTVASVALFKGQECQCCGSSHRYFLGWYTEQKHISDPNARRLIMGKPVEILPERTETHSEGMIELCFVCIEQAIAMDVAAGRALLEDGNPLRSHHEPASNSGRSDWAATVRPGTQTHLESGLAGQSAQASVLSQAGGERLSN